MFEEHQRSITKCAFTFSVAEHFKSHKHSLHDMQVHGIKLYSGNKQRKVHEMHLIFQLGRWQLRSLNSDFHFCWGSQELVITFKLNSDVLMRWLPANYHSTFEGLCPKRLGFFFRLLALFNNNFYFFLYPTKYHAATEDFSSFLPAHQGLTWHFLLGSIS